MTNLRTRTAYAVATVIAGLVAEPVVDIADFNEKDGQEIFQMADAAIAEVRRADADSDCNTQCARSGLPYIRDADLRWVLDMYRDAADIIWGQGANVAGLAFTNDLVRIVEGEEPRKYLSGVTYWTSWLSELRTEQQTTVARDLEKHPLHADIRPLPEVTGYDNGGENPGIGGVA